MAELNFTKKICCNKLLCSRFKSFEVVGVFSGVILMHNAVKTFSDILILWFIRFYCKPHKFIVTLWTQQHRLLNEIIRIGDDIMLSIFCRACKYCVLPSS
jgi:hypothetical protein